MPTYVYKAATASGEVVEGRMEAPDDGTVVRRLQAEGHIPIRAELATTEITSARRRLGGLGDRRPVSRRDVELITVELATLLESGLTLDRALAIMAELASREPVRAMLERLNAHVRGGADLSTALAGEGELFPRFYVSMVRAGEAGGDLGGAAARLAQFLERARALRDALVSALLYPAILVVVACLSIAVILGVVVPRISEMFADAGQALPLATRMIVALGGFVEHYWWLGVAALVAAWLGGRRALADPAIRLRVDAMALRLPVVGELVGKLEAARFTRALGTLLQNGVPLVQALGIAREVVGNATVAKALAVVSDEVQAGEGLAKPLVKASVFPRLAGHLVRIGEEAGELEAMLLRLAEIYDVEVHTAVGRTVAILGPVMILALGVIIGGLILSILAALLSINELVI